MSARLEEGEALVAGRDCVSANLGIETKRGAAGRRQNRSLYVKAIGREEGHRYTKRKRAHIDALWTSKQLRKAI